MQDNQLASAISKTVEEWVKPSLVPEQLYFVMPEKFSLKFEVVLADPGEAGHEAIARHYPDVALSFDIDQLAQIEQHARTGPMFVSGPHWFKKPYHFYFVAIKDEKPVDRFLVQATDVSKAIKKATRVAPGCQFQLVGTLETYAVAGRRMLQMLEDDCPLFVPDLRTPIVAPSAGLLILDGMGGLPQELRPRWRVRDLEEVLNMDRPDAGAASLDDE